MRLRGGILPPGGTTGVLVLLEPEQARHLYRRHVQGAFVRSGASLVMWCFAFSAFLMDIVTADNLLGVSLSVAFLILMNPPTLWILKHVRRRHLFEAISLLINALDVLAFTGIIYSLGGINSLWLSLTLAALITYVAVLGPSRMPFMLVGLSSLSLSGMVFLVYWGIIPRLQFPGFSVPPLGAQAITLSSTVGLLWVVAFIAAYTGSILRKQKVILRAQNVDLEQSRRDLKGAVADLAENNIELQAAVERARSSDKAKSEFLANMSHELRTPLNHIIGFTELVVGKNFGDLTETQAEYLNDVLQSSRHLLSLINDVLDLSKVEAGKLELNLGDVDLRGILEGSLAMVREKALAHGIRLSVEADGIPEIISADERKLKQIFYNLLSNAVKFTPEGGEIRMTANTISDFGLRTSDLEKDGGGPADNSASRNPQPGIVVSVADTGIGLRPEDLERIFKPFEQADNSASRRYQGTGLGLSLTRRLAELHAGRIWAESAGEGKGSVFHFVLPLPPLEKGEHPISPLSGSYLGQMMSTE
jgi:signal transduction histidine kinase